MLTKMVEKIEKLRPFFEKFTNNPYLRAIRDGFITLIPVILFSSLFLLVAFVPNVFEIYWSEEVEGVLMKAYDYSMGILAVLMSATIARSLTDNFNGKLPAKTQINPISVMMVSIIGFMMISVDPIDGGFAMDYMGTQGLLSAFVVGFITPNIYKFFVKRDLTIKLPKEVPNNISQTFKDLIPLATGIIFFWLFDLAFRSVFGSGFSEWIQALFQPLFSAADGYLGLALIFGAMAFFWFVGIHGPSIVEPAVAAIYIANVEANFMMAQQGEHASNVLSQGSQYFVATLGGTGATFMITYMFAFLAKSKQLKAVGRASSVPVFFGVNEPVLFGAPLVLNPVFFIPFILSPILNVWLFRFFVESGMDGFIYNLPWTTPGPIGLIMGTGFAAGAFVLVPLLLTMNFLVYYPFMKVYDNQLLDQEEQNRKEMAAKGLDENGAPLNGETQADQPSAEPAAAATVDGQKNILVLCANGATSSMLSNAIQEGAEKQGAEVEATALAYGQHKEQMAQYDLIILAPQMGSMLDELSEEAETKGTKAISTEGGQYVQLARDPEGALQFAIDNLPKAN
ncbi:PTS transporter subunit EIIC [Salisediminibacterium halotolerans]|uniref:PTS system lactose-specific EIICB component n=1 Tax=Salisediminibacterium halotolerans TaxID=517425 RepID=A0A1H9U7B8_9BACI|nr:PTS transporter subunit EIIC [Salisediminibacterium haloalkalitolerans]SES05355.1 PTS system, lactose-specific IIC component [Salisediminibacterium haloalkalitolerans]